MRTLFHILIGAVLVAILKDIIGSAMRNESVGAMLHASGSSALGCTSWYGGAQEFVNIV